MLVTYMGKIKKLRNVGNIYVNHEKSPKSGIILCEIMGSEACSETIRPLDILISVCFEFSDFPHICTYHLKPKLAKNMQK